MSMQELRTSELCSIAENLGMDQELIGNCLDDYRGAKDSLIAEFIDLVDTDRDGTIDKAELKLALEKGSKLSQQTYFENPLEGGPDSTAPTSLASQSSRASSVDLNKIE